MLANTNEAYLTRVLPMEAVRIRTQDVVSLAAFRRATRYSAICPACKTTRVVQGYPTTHPPLCACNTRMVAMVSA